MLKFAAVKTAACVTAFLLLCGCESERDQRIRYYNAQLAMPLSTIQVYGSSYAENQARCNPKAGKYDLAKTFCEMAKGDLARVQLAQRQALAVFQDMSNDSLLSEQDRENARSGIARLQSQP